MSEINDGGPAFPVAIWDGRKMRYIDDGMTLRDYFAAKAMQGLVSDFITKTTEKITLDKFVYATFEIADAMLKARKS